MAIHRPVLAQSLTNMIPASIRTDSDWENAYLPYEDEPARRSGEALGMSGAESDSAALCRIFGVCGRESALPR